MRAKVLAVTGAPFAVDIPVTLVDFKRDARFAGGATMLRVPEPQAGAVDGVPVTVTRTEDFDRDDGGGDRGRRPVLYRPRRRCPPESHRAYAFAKAGTTIGLPATILPRSEPMPDG